MKRIVLVMMLSGSLCGCAKETFGVLAATALGLLGMGGQSETPQTVATKTLASGLNPWWLLVIPLAIIVVISVPKEVRK